MEEKEIKEILGYEILNLKNYMDTCFQEQAKNNSIFFDNILELIKATINKENETKNIKLEKLIEELNKSSEINKAISSKLISEICELDNIYGTVAPKKENKIIYEDIKKGIMQFSIQVVIVMSIILMIFGASKLISVIF